MTYTILKFCLSAAVVVAVSEIARRSSLFGALVASLPLTSLLAMVWLWRDTHDPTKIATLSTGIFWMVLPSLALFLALPFLLKRGVAFWPALGASVVIMLVCYGGMVGLLGRLGIKL